MEFLKTCNTNAQAIVRIHIRAAPVRADTAQGDFEAIIFQAFSATRNPPRTSSRIYDWSPTDDIREAEAELRNEEHLVVQDVSKPSWLWLFRPTTADQAGQKPPDLPVLEGYLFQRQYSPSFSHERTDFPKVNNMAS